jgi:tRNA pseudouridine55 synthase
MINLYKYQGETPLQALERLRKTMPEYRDATLSYAGRLDPMAEGVLLVMVGNENNERQKYLSLDKEYTIEVLFGFETDTADILGLVTSQAANRKCTQADIEKVLEKYQGTFMQEYPAYSSQPVDGKPLYQWAREGRLNEIVIPRKEVTIYSTNVLQISKVSSADLYVSIEKKVNRVIGDFRQDHIMSSWRQYLNKEQTSEYVIAKINVNCSSGTYMRTLAQNIGKGLNIPACIYSIIRTKIGEHTVEFSTHA